MITYNLHHPDTVQKTVTVIDPRIRIERNGRFSFSMSAINQFSIQVPLRCHVLRFHNQESTFEWGLKFDLEKSGFLLRERKKSIERFESYFFSKSMADIISESVGFQLPLSFRIKDCDSCSGFRGILELDLVIKSTYKKIVDAIPAAI